MDLRIIIICMMMPRYTRNPMTRALLERLENRESDDDEHDDWYQLDKDVLTDELIPHFTQSSLDSETRRFLENCMLKSDAILTQIYQGVAKAFLTWFMSSTTVNGLLNRGSMFVFSHSQLLALVSESEDWRVDTLLDLGAGDGKITDVMAPHANHVFVTENSPTMRWRLSSRDFRVLEIDAWQHQQYDVIVALNLLDRIDDGGAILKQIRDAIHPVHGIVIVALVLPYRPCVESGSSFVPVKTRMPISGRSIEQQITSVVKDVFLPAGFSLHRFTRLPYLCEGSFHRDYFVLSDIVFSLKPSVPTGECHAHESRSAVQTASVT